MGGLTRLGGWHVAGVGGTVGGGVHLEERGKIRGLK